MSVPHIALARAAEERRGAYALRYAVYVDEHGKHCGEADHMRRLLSDPEDAGGWVFLATRAGVVDGTVRLVPGDAPLTPSTRACFASDELAELLPPEQLSFASRLAVVDGARGTELSLALVRAAVDFEVRRGARAIFCACQPHLLGFFRRVGFRPYRPPFSDPEVGILLPLVLLLGDVAGQERLGSPLRDLLRPAAEPPETVDRLKRRLARVTGYARRCQPLSACWEAVDPLLRARLRRPEPCLLEGLSPRERRRLFARSFLLPCARDDLVIQAGQSTRSLFYVATGELTVQGNGEPPRSVGAGGVVGEVGFLLATRQASDVKVASRRARLISLGARAFGGPGAAGRVARTFLLNISRSVTWRGFCV